MPDSVLNGIKDALGVAEANTAFDAQLVLHINSVLSNLNQLGVGPSEGVAITGSTEEWSAALDDDVLLNNVKSYMFLRVKLLFDSPTNAAYLSSIKEQIKEAEWRIRVYADETTDLSNVTVIDGGSP